MWTYFAEFFVHVLLAVVCVCGDVITDRSKKHSMIKAMADNLTHGIVASLVWLLFLRPAKLRWMPGEIAQIGICGLIGCIIDVDHFIAAQSLNLKGALSLDRRPFLHCSTIPVLILLILLIITKVKHTHYPKLVGFIIFASMISHHIRDGSRRGLWFFPFDSTPPLPYLLYIALELLLPHLVRMHFYEPSNVEMDIV